MIRRNPNAAVAGTTGLAVSLVIAGAAALGVELSGEQAGVIVAAASTIILALGRRRGSSTPEA